ncbi:FA_desaturase domain-containing protein [Haematococcus lacustris]|uniref:FA_desaturase domain-containing protein n=1 Tax=Haematococcus lacustris TaxID=44745 RepID=A0A699YLQ7_HAELA|nr:FA_desaturase domain-containing protein [Haematococcus lacustris]
MLHLSRCVRPTIRDAAALKAVVRAGPERTAAGRSDRDMSTAAAMVEVQESTLSTESVTNRLAGLSYSQQYDLLFQTKPLNIKQIVPKPDRQAQAAEPGSSKVLLSDVHAVPKRPSLFGREWNSTDMAYAAFIGGMHLLACAAPWTFSWPMVGLFFATYFISGCLGITLSYHRQLSHRSFQTPKWLEYVLAYCGVLAVQGDPSEWVSSHRYHHLHCDTPLDPHSPYEGFWWSHAGWLLDNKATIERVYNRNNASDMDSQWFYRWLRDTYAWHVVAQFAVLFALGGLPAVVWGGALRVCWVYHVTWFVNSASHVWGSQSYNTGDLSRNNWWVGILAFGEGWHNNHHAFEFSARHGLEWWQVDVTWGMVWLLQRLGLATNVKLPSERQKQRLAF